MHPARTFSVALFACPHCIDEFAFDWQRVRNLPDGWRVRVRCPGCVNIVEVVRQGYPVIHHCDPTKYKWGEITEILPPDPKRGDWWMSVNKLRMKSCKGRLDGDLSHASENHGWPLSHIISQT